MILTDTLQITQAHLNAIASIDEFKGAWKAIGALSPERLRALRHVATVESIGSSTRIEGSKLSDREVDALLSKLEIQKFDTRDEQEVAGYAALMELIFESWEQIPVTENYIKQLHAMLLRPSEKDQHHRGKYKTVPNHVSAFTPEGKELGVIFETASPFETPGRMAELVEWYTQEAESKTLHPLLRIAVFVVVFLEIHPFQDGNGRLSRGLTTLLLLKCGYQYAPYSSLESFIEENKEGYYLALRQTQQTIRTKHPDWEPWVSFFLSVLKKQTEHLRIKVERENELLIALPAHALAILHHARAHGRVSMAEMVQLTGVSRNTLKPHFKHLTENGYLLLVGKGRGSWYKLSDRG